MGCGRAPRRYYWHLPRDAFRKATGSRSAESHRIRTSEARAELDATCFCSQLGKAIGAWLQSSAFDFSNRHGQDIRFRICDAPPQSTACSFPCAPRAGAKAVYWQLQTRVRKEEDVRASFGQFSRYEPGLPFRDDADNVEGFIFEPICSKCF